ncbi:MAG: XTP/dITP diphosphatase [bacterium]
MEPKNIIFIATRNRGKLREISDLLQGEGYLLHSLIDYPHIPSVDEAGETLEENARKKALEVAKATGHITLADDSSLEIEALGGGPGVHSARFLGEKTSDRDRNSRILELMRGYRGGERKARFRCVIAIARTDGTCCLVHGECQGNIAEHPRGTGGFGYDPIFYLPSYEKTMAEIEPELKNRVSHRGRAIEKAKEILREITQSDPYGCQRAAKPGSDPPED